MLRPRGPQKNVEVRHGMAAALSSAVSHYNFCWPVRTLRVRGEEGGWEARTPALAAGLTDHVWSLREWVTFPGIITSRATVNKS
jgi:hypothetical protein